MEEELLEHGYTYRELWDSVSIWFSEDEMIEFLEEFADNRDVRFFWIDD
jgi:hypothetical protein